MRRELERLIRSLNTRVMYFTENPISIDDYYGYKYFLVWQNTHQVFKGFRTLAECVEFLKEVVKEKIVWVDGFGFKIFKEGK